MLQYLSLLPLFAYCFSSSQPFPWLSLLCWCLTTFLSLSTFSALSPCFFPSIISVLSCYFASLSSGLSVLTYSFSYWSRPVAVLPAAPSCFYRTETKGGSWTSIALVAQTKPYGFSLVFIDVITAVCSCFHYGWTGGHPSQYNLGTQSIATASLTVRACKMLFKTVTLTIAAWW